MSKWIKENLVLVSGIVLPVLLVAGFFVLNKAPRILTDPPEYDFMLVAYRSDYQHPRKFHLGFEVRDGQLRGKVTPVNDDHSHLNRQYAGIFRYHAAANRFEEIVYELPEGLDELEEVLEFTVAETRQLELDKRAKSPDGFTFQYLGYRGRGGLLGEIFGMGSNRGNEYVLSKAGAQFKLPKPATDPYYYHHDMHFMGWITGDGETQ